MDEVNLDLLNYRLNRIFNAFIVDDFGNLITQRELIGKIDSLKLSINPKDHNPPHFHVLSSNIDACFHLENCELLKGEIDSKSHRKIKEWHKNSKDELWAVWIKHHSKT